MDKRFEYLSSAWFNEKVALLLRQSAEKNCRLIGDLNLERALVVNPVVLLA